MKPVIDARRIVKQFRLRKGVHADWQFGNLQWLVQLGLRSFFEIRTFTALDGVDLQIEAGECFGLLGANGAGKTTLMKCLTTLLAPDSGEIRINGFDAARQPLEIRRCITLVGAHSWTGLDWSLTVRENLRYHAMLSGCSDAEFSRRCGEVVDLVRLEPHVDRYPGALSAGTRQKVVLARGLLSRTPILILDEPTVGLDPVSAQEVRDFIRTDLATSGMTILLASHQTREIAEVANRVGVMDSGRMIACGTQDELTALVSTRGVTELRVRGSTPRLLEQLRALPGVRALSSSGQEGEFDRTIRVHCDPAANAFWDLVKTVDSCAADLLSVQPTERSLEDAYLALVGEGVTEHATESPQA